MQLNRTIRNARWRPGRCVVGIEWLSSDPVVATFTDGTLCVRESDEVREKIKDLPLFADIERQKSEGDDGDRPHSGSSRVGCCKGTTGRNACARNLRCRPIVEAGRRRGAAGPEKSKRRGGERRRRFRIRGRDLEQWGGSGREARAASRLSRVNQGHWRGIPADEAQATKFLEVCGRNRNVRR